MEAEQWHARDRGVTLAPSKRNSLQRAPSCSKNCNSFPKRVEPSALISGATMKDWTGKPKSAIVVKQLTHS
jgi:hypothetical protein